MELTDNEIINLLLKRVEEMEQRLANLEKDKLETELLVNEISKQLKEI